MNWTPLIGYMLVSAMWVTVAFGFHTPRTGFILLAIWFAIPVLFFAWPYLYFLLIEKAGMREKAARRIGWFVWPALVIGSVCYLWS